MDQGGDVVGEPEDLGEPHVGPAGLQALLWRSSPLAEGLVGEGTVDGLEGELPQHADAELAIRLGQGRPEQLQGAAEVEAPFAGATEPEVGLGELALPAGPPEPGRFATISGGGSRSSAAVRNSTASR
jgi:hypothetical protein